MASAKTKRNKSSEIWLHFDDCENENKLAKCRQPTSDAPTETVDNVPCTALASQNSTISGNSGSVAVVQRVSSTVAKLQQTSLSHLIKKKISLPEKKRYDELLMDLFIKDYQPFSIVEDEGFRRFINALAPDYKILGRKYLSTSLLDLMYNSCYESTREEIRAVTKVCLTTDHWTSAANQNFMGITVHFIDENFKMRSKLLKCVKFEGPHTATEIAAELKRTATEWEIIDKILIVVSDNASNVTKAITDVLKLKHYGCFAHTLNLVVQDALKSQSAIIEKIKTIVNHFKRSPQATEKLLKCQQQLGSTELLKVILNVETRWNSTYYMIKRLITIQEAIRSTVANLKAAKIQMLSEEEWKICEQICTLLNPFEKATSEMSGEHYLTGSMIIVMAEGLTSVTKRAVELNYCEDTTGFAQQLINDPRFKLYIFDNEAQAQEIKKHIINIVTAIINFNTSRREVTIQQTEAEADNLSYWSTFDKKMEKLLPKGTATSQATIEVDNLACSDKYVPIIKSTDKGY
ncbi:hypothetical protein NQ315_014667 [Exocentrus adspersus]|uniref:Transposase n=1 Tax=Exocentrus adspersus TaxID=1586481 RepID=A0AAV8VQX4_9CUCU|nr:hypothetical protein NQ315_014667 [Exocentrus adspersus]